jgi:hypothetical protein
MQTNEPEVIQVSDDDARDPARLPGVRAAVDQLERELRRALGPSAHYVLVIALDRDGVYTIQPVTDCCPDHARLLLRWAHGSGFHAVN